MQDDTLRVLYQQYHETVGAPAGEELSSDEVARHFIEEMVGAGEQLVPLVEQRLGLRLIARDPRISAAIRRDACEEYELTEAR